MTSDAALRNFSSAIDLLAPSVRFPITIAVVCYGANSALARRFLESLYRCTPPELFHLRAGLNEVEPATAALFSQYQHRFNNVECFIETRNTFKSPLMRRLFHDKPLESEWMVWCDDDTHFTRADWLIRLATRIQQIPAVDMWGAGYRLWSDDAGLLEWIKSARWYRGLPWVHGLNEHGRSGVTFDFATGGFWALRASVIQHLNWPDPRLVQAQEDFILGEAIRQNGFRLASFTYGVAISDAPRRNACATEITELQ